MDMVKKTVKLTKDPSGAPATDLGALGSDHVDLKKRADKAGISLSKRGLDGIRGRVIVLLDHSGSMFHLYQDGSVQKLVERALGFALQIDTDGQIEIIPFDSVMHHKTVVDVSNYQGVVDRELWRRSNMGGTNMAQPFRSVEQEAAESEEPIFLIVIGDGSPSDRSATTQAVADLASYPVFIKFLALEEIDYLKKLDDDIPVAGSGLSELLGRARRGPTRLVDNVDAKPSDGGKPLLEMTDLEFADAMTDEWSTWITAAQGAGLLS